MTKPLYFWNGSSFELVGPTTPQSPFAYQTSAPTAPATGDIWIDSDGDVDTYNRQLTRYYFVATAGQTSVSGTDANGLTLAYVAGSEAVYVNGALQVRGVDYTATNGTSITGLSALALNDVVEVFAYTAFTVANAYTKTETDSVAAAATGMRLVVPTSVAVGSGSGSIDSNGAITFSGASSISINGCFTSAYDNYKITIQETASGNVALYWRGRTSGTDNSNSNYDWRTFYNDRTTLAVNTGTDNTSSAQFSDTGSSRSSHILEVINPFLSQPTQVFSRNYISDGNGYVKYGGSQFDTTTSFDGITFYLGSGTFSGTIRVYGFKN